MRGGEKVLEVLLDLLPGAPIHTLFHFPGSVSERIESRPIRTSFLQRAPGLRRHYRKYLPLFPRAVEALDLRGSDLVVSTSHCVAKSCLKPAGAWHLCYCHTPMRYVWDQQRAYFPERGDPVARLRDAVLARLRRWDVATAGRVDRYVANSTFVADRIRRSYGRQAEVVPPPVDVDFFTPGEGEPGTYCLAVSALSPYKRLDLAIAACERLGIELRIVGEGPERRRLERLAGPRTRLLGRLDGERLRALYRGALCFVQPGIEDFGIASAEALACGVPVVALDRGGVRDVVVDGEHGVLYAAADSDGAGPLAAAVDKIQKIRFNKMNLHSRAEGFSPGRFADRLGSVLASGTLSLEGDGA
jgi:glycosyltransferase involved in cell wall biosynthesis